MSHVDSTMSRGTVRFKTQVSGFTLQESAYEPHSSIRPHAHDRHKISLILSGSADETSLRTVHDCHAGSVVVKPAGADHSNRFGAGGLRTFGVYCASGDAPDEAAARWTDALSRYRWIHGGPVTHAMECLYRLCSGTAAREALCVEELTLHITDLLLGDAPVAESERAPSWLGTVRDYLHTYYAQPIKVADLATMVGSHPVYVARVFRARYGCSITRYVRRLRVRHAMSRLADGGVSLSQVARDAGFADQAHLCRVFKAHCGLTPGAWRRLACAG